MSRPLAFPRPLAWDDDYCLCRCQGFYVDSPAGPIGRVAELQFGSRLDRSDALLVESGLLGGRRLIVAVSEVDQIVPARQRLLLRNLPRPTDAQHRFERIRKKLAATIGVH